MTIIDGQPIVDALRSLIAECGCVPEDVHAVKIDGRSITITEYCEGIKSGKYKRTHTTISISTIVE